ncbi:MAG: response regulator, partial [Chthoniobacterales bacterium]|nr:response regulator [Chthoniobacterales bacterium]
MFKCGGVGMGYALRGEREMKGEKMEVSEPVEVILVEDEEDLLEGMKFSFELEGYVVRKFEEGQRAKEFLEGLEGAPNAVLVADICLPGVSGVELIELFKRRWPHLAAVAITGFGDKEMLTALLRAKCDEFLDKPFEMGELVGLVRRALAVQEKRNRESVVLLRSLPSMQEFFRHYTVAGDNRRDREKLQGVEEFSVGEVIRVERLSTMAKVEVKAEWAGRVSEEAVRVFEGLLTSGVRHIELD